MRLRRQWPRQPQTRRQRRSLPLLLPVLVLLLLLLLLVVLLLHVIQGVQCKQTRDAAEEPKRDRTFLHEDLAPLLLGTDAAAAPWAEMMSREAVAGLLREVGEDVTMRSLSTLCCNRFLERHRQRKQLSIGVLGDAVAAPTRAADGGHKWPGLLEALLQGLRWNATVENCAVAGRGPRSVVETVSARSCGGCHDVYILAFDEGMGRTLGNESNGDVLKDYRPLQGQLVQLALKLWQLSCEPDVIVWNLLPPWQPWKVNRMNGYLAHIGAARSLNLPHLSLYASLYGRYVHSEGHTSFFPKDSTTAPGAPTHVLSAAILADFITRAPLSTYDAPKETMEETFGRAGQCVWDVIAPDLSGGGAAASAVGVMTTSPGVQVTTDKSGRPGWRLSASNTSADEMTIQLAPAHAGMVRAVAVSFFRQTTAEWGSFAVRCNMDGAARGVSAPTERVVSSNGPQPKPITNGTNDSRASRQNKKKKKKKPSAAGIASVVSVEVCKNASSVTIRAVSGLNHVQAVKFCPEPPPEAAATATTAAQPRGREEDADDDAWVKGIFLNDGIVPILRRMWRTQTVKESKLMTGMDTLAMDDQLQQVGRDLTLRSAGTACCNAFLADARAEKRLSIGVFGGSVTVGNNCIRRSAAADHGEEQCSWPDMMGEILRELGWNVAVENCAQGGTKPDFGADVAASQSCGCHELYILGYGANNQYLFPRHNSPIVATESAFHTVFASMKNLIHTLWRLPCHPEVLIWDEMPHWQLNLANGGASPFVNAISASLEAARETNVGHISLFLSLYHDYVRRQGEAAYFRQNNPHPLHRTYALMAAIMADYIDAAPLSATDAPRETLLAHAETACNRVVALPGDQSSSLLRVSGDGYTVGADPHGRMNWFVEDRATLELQLPHGGGEDIAVVFLRSYTPEWGSFAVKCVGGTYEKHFKFRFLPTGERRIESHDERIGSIFARYVTCTRASALKIRSLSGKNQIHAVSYCAPPQP